MRPVSLILSAVLAVSLLSCSEPRMTETFIRSGDARGCYTYSLDMSDTLSTYSLYFFTRIDGSRDRPGMVRGMALDISFRSPSGRRYSEKAVIPPGSFSEGGHFTMDCLVPYRTGFVPSEYGEWTMYVSVEGESVLDGFRGLGLRVIRQKATL